MSAEIRNALIVLGLLLVVYLCLLLVSLIRKRRAAWKAFLKAIDELYYLD